jgi:integrase
LVFGFLVAATMLRAGISPKFRLYDLRHTALTRMAMAGVDRPTLKSLPVMLKSK